MLEIDASIAATPPPPYVAVIFTSLRAPGDDGYAETAAAMNELAARQPGYLGVEAAREGLGITVSYWRDEASARAWKGVAEHLAAQRRGRELWYRDYRVRVATVTRDYGPLQSNPAQAHTPLSEVLAVLDALEQAGCRYWLEGGWGVDALAGRQTRHHRDVDVDVDDRDEASALAAVSRLGYVVETDWRPNRVELLRSDAAGGERARVDVHPIEVHHDGSARQVGMDGEIFLFPARFFTAGSLNGRTVPCFSVEAQRWFRTGYPPRHVDEHDLGVLDGL